MKIRKSTLAWCAALAVLAAALVVFNQPSSGRRTAVGAVTDPAGNGTAADAATDSVENGTAAGAVTDSAGNGTAAGAVTDSAGKRTVTGRPAAETKADASNNVASDESNASAEALPGDAGSAPYGSQVGEQLPDFSITQTDGTDFRLQDFRGKVTVINLWATWCTPCVNELPYFDRLQREYADTVKVLAIHSDLITDDVDEYLAGFDYGMSFAVDERGGVIALVKGSTMLPQTIVLNPRGEVTYNQVGSVTYEVLEELVQKALN